MKNKGVYAGCDNVKLAYLKDKLRRVKDISRYDVMRVLGVSYTHAFNYVNALKDLRKK